MDLEKMVQRVARHFRNASDDEELNCGFAIRTSPQGVIEDNFRDKHNREPTDDEWDQINEDVETIERNGLKYLKRVLDNARDEGHASDGDLIGSCWAKWDDKKALEVIWEHHDDDASYGQLSSQEEREFYRGIKPDAVDAELYFFNIDKDDLDRLEELVG